MVWRATVDRPRAVCRAVVSRVDAAGARSRTCRNLLSLNRGYNYGMTNVIERSPFSELGDQQLLEQTRRLAANQRCLDVHILDHLDEIDRRGLALRRGFSSLFDYAVRELHFSDAAAQRRIQAMRLCRRHGWVRACLQSGALSMTSAGQLETTFAGAERAERQSHAGHRNVGRRRGHDQDHDSAGRTRQLGLPAAPGEADEQGEREQRSAPGDAPPAGECSGDVGERGHRSVPGGAPPAGGCSGDVATGYTPAVPVASRAGAQAPGAGHAGVLLPRPELNGNASPFPASSCAPVAAHGAGAGAGAGSAAPSSDEGPAPQLMPPADLPASASTPEPVPEPVVAPSESRHTASCASEPLRDDPVVELSPGTVSTAPLLHPQRQRELIEQAAGMSTRQVANLLAAAAPEVLPPRDTLRAAAPDRYTLKVSIDQECEQGLRLLKDLMSHVDPRMSWGDLVARLVREAVARHDPRGDGSGQRRRRSAGSASSARSAGASPRRAPKETRAAGPAGGPAQRGGESSGRAPNWTGADGAAAGPAQRGSESSPWTPNWTGADGAAAGPAQRGGESSGRAPNRTRDAVAPVAPARRTGGATPAPPGDAAATESQHPIGVLASAVPPSQSAPAAPLDGASAGGAPSGTSAATSAPQSAPAELLDGARAGCAPLGTSAATSAPQSAPAARLDGARAGGAPSGAPAATSAPQSAPAARLDGARAGGAPSGASAATSAPQSAPAARLDGARAGGAPSGAPAATSAPKFASGALADGPLAGTAVPGTPVATSAAEPALGGSPDGGPSSASAGGVAGAVAGASAAGFSAGDSVPGAPVATSAPEPAIGGSPDGGPSGPSAGAVAGAVTGASAAGFFARAGVPGAPVATSAPGPALGVPPDGGPSGASAGAAGGASAVGFSARAGVPGSPVASAAPEPALGVFPDGGPPEASAGAAAHPTRDSAHNRCQSPPRLHIPAAVRRHVWLRDGARCCYRNPLSGRRCTSSHLLQIDHLLPVAEGGGPEPSNLVLLCFAHHRMRHGYGPAMPPESPM